MEGKEYYYLKGEDKAGPFSLDALKSEPITASTLVWNSTLPDWVAASTLPELQELFATQTAPPPPVQAPPAYNQKNAFGGANVPPPMPENYLVWAILATVLCCWPIGIFAIINSTKVGSAYNSGDYEGAQKASESAKKLAIWTAVGGAIAWVFIIIFYAIIFAASGAFDY
jgi:hypothetical protein